MNSNRWIILGSFSLLLGGYAQQQPFLSSEYTPPERGPHHTRWIKVGLVTNQLLKGSVQQLRVVCVGIFPGRRQSLFSAVVRPRVP